MAVCISPTYTAVCLVLYLRLGASASQVGATGSTENLLALVGELQKQLQEEQSLKSVSGAAQAQHDAPAAKPPSTAGPLLALTGAGCDEMVMDGIDGDFVEDSDQEEQANSEVIEAVQKLHVEQSKKRDDKAKEAEKIHPVATLAVPQIATLKARQAHRQQAFLRVRELLSLSPQQAWPHLQWRQQPISSQ